jgi:hypothetical protein
MMMAKVFANEQPTEPVPTARPVENKKPRMAIAIEHLDHAHGHINRAMQVLSSIILDLQRGADFIGGYRDSLIKTVDDAGGDVEAAIESQIREFIPKSYRTPAAEDQSA